MRSTKKRIYKDFDKEAFLKSLKDAKSDGLFREMLDSNDIDEAVDSFTKVFTSVLDKHAPEKTIQFHKNYVPYLNPELKGLMKYRDLIKKSYFESGDPDTFTEYKKLRNKICSKLKEAKKLYFQSQLNSKDTKKSWNMVHNLMNKPQNSFPQQMFIKDKIVTSPQELAEEMNEYFCGGNFINKRKSCSQR